MLRRYVIVNGVVTALMYGAVWAYAPSVSSFGQTLRDGFDIYALDHALLGPVWHGIITVTGG